MHKCVLQNKIKGCQKYRACGGNCACAYTGKMPVILGAVTIAGTSVELRTVFEFCTILSISVLALLSNSEQRVVKNSASYKCMKLEGKYGR